MYIHCLMLKLKLQYFGHLMGKADSSEKTLILGKTEGKKRNGTAEDEMVGWHHQLDGHEFEQAPGDSGGQRSLVCCSPWGHGVGHNLATKQETPQSSLTTSPMWGPSEKTATSKPGIRPSLDTESTAPRSWTSQPPELWEISVGCL